MYVVFLDERLRLGRWDGLSTGWSARDMAIEGALSREGVLVVTCDTLVFLFEVYTGVLRWSMVPAGDI